MYFWWKQTTAASICTEQIEPGQAHSAVAEARESRESDKIKCNLSKSTKSGRRDALLLKRSSVAHVRLQRCVIEQWESKIGVLAAFNRQHEEAAFRIWPLVFRTKVVFSKLRESTPTVCLPTGLLCFRQETQDETCAAVQEAEVFTPNKQY